MVPFWSSKLVRVEIFLISGYLFSGLASSVYNYFSNKLQMRYLKRKILITPDREDSDDEQEQEELHQAKALLVGRPSKSIKKIDVKLAEQPAKKKRKRLSKSRQMNLRTKNIVKNYGKAIASFSTSDIAVPYLEPLCKEEKVEVSAFVDYVVNRKEFLDNIENLKNSLVKENNDSLEVSFKKIFRKIAEVFLKYFSVNWIFSGRVIYKLEHLYFRGKMLRRIKMAESFSNLKSQGKP